MRKQTNDKSHTDSSKNLFALNNVVTDCHQDLYQTENITNTPNMIQNQADFNNDQHNLLLFSEKDLFIFEEKNSNKGSEEANFQGNIQSNFSKNIERSNPIQIPNYIINNEININNPNNKDKDNIKVIARIRPRNHKENERCDLIDVMQNTIKLKNKPEELFTFDFVATEEITQEQMFEKCAKEVADNVLQGYNGTIFAYGQTSAGKTYTLIGPRENINEKMTGSNVMKNVGNEISMGINANSNTLGAQSVITGGYEAKKVLSINSEKRGIIPRAIEYILKNTSEKKEENTEISLSCSFLEIYNEELRDLLDEKNIPKKVEIREINENQEEEKQDTNNKKSKNLIKNINSNINKILEKKNINEKVQKIINIYNLQKNKFNDYDQAIQYLAQGLEKRKVGGTKMNEESSRSHAIFSIYLEMKQRINNNIKTKKSVFHMVDLAGSERQSDTGAVGARLNESGNINNSLMVLRKVLESLEPSKKLNHIPYRDSKLTFALKDSLGGNSKTCIITNISPANSNNSDTFNTLNFGKIARKVKNEAKINEELYVDNAWEQLTFEREKTKKLFSENARLIQKQKEQKQKYEELYGNYINCLKKIEKQNENKMDICGKDESNEFDPKLVFGPEGEDFNNNINNYLYGNSNLNSNYNANRFNSKAQNLYNFTNNLNNINRGISDDSTREDYKITYDNCFKELERQQEELKNKDLVLSEKFHVIEKLQFTNLEFDALITLLKKEIENLKQTNVNLSKDYLTGDKDLTNVMIKNSAYECEIEKLKDIIEEKEKEIHKKNENIINIESKLNIKINSLEERLDYKKKEVQAIEEENRLMDKRIKDLESENNKKNNNITEFFEIVDKLRKEKEDLRKIIDEKKSVIENLSKQKAEISDKGTKLIESYNERLEKKEKEKVKLEEDLRKNISILEQSNCLVYNIKDSYMKLNDEYHEYKAKNQELIEENMLLKKEIEESNKREREMMEKNEEMKREISDITKNENIKRNHGKINYIDKLRGRVEELEAETGRMRQKELFLDNLVSKLKLNSKNANKIKPEQLEKSILETEKLKDNYEKCLEKSFQKIEKIQFTAETRYGFSYFFHNKRMSIFSSIEQHFSEKLETLISFTEFLLKYNQDNKNQLDKKNFLLSNLDKWKKLNDSYSEDIKEKTNKIQAVQSENEENPNNLNEREIKESNKRSSIIDNILKSGSCSKLKDTKYGTKRKASQISSINSIRNENVIQDLTQNLNIDKTKTIMTQIKNNDFPKLDLGYNLTFGKAEKVIEENKIKFDDQRVGAILINNECIKNFNINSKDKINLPAEEKKENLNFSQSGLKIESDNKEGLKSKFLNPFLLNVNKNPDLNIENEHREKIDNVKKSLDKMDIID